MSNYLIPIRSAFFIFPIIAALFTIPYVLTQYHKYGSIPSLRVVVVYSLILYLITAYFLVILPLPTIDEVMKLKTPTMQLIPFQFVIDLINNTSFVITNPSTYLKALTEPEVYQIFYNILLFVPFGVYLRYYFKCSFKKTILYSFLLSLFFELTQLSGLYGYYPRGYRLFDIDDLMINTLGGMVGYYLTEFVFKILPSRDKLDQYAYTIGENITVWKRITNLIIDFTLVGTFTIITTAICCLFREVSILFIEKIVVFIYFVIIPSLSKGQTLGKKFLNMRLVTLNTAKPKTYQYFFRYFILYEFIFPLPFYLLYGLSSISHFFEQKTLFMFGGIAVIFLVTFLYYFTSFVHMLKGEWLWYEKLSRTQNRSTIPEKRKAN